MITDLLRKIPNFKGKQRFMRYLLRNDIAKRKNIIVNGKFDLKYKLPNIIDAIGFGIYINGIYEPLISGLIINQLPANGVYMDIGANIGSIAMPVCKQRPDISAICIEASPKIFHSLKTNFKLNNLSNCILLNKAVSDKDGELLFYMNEQEYFGQGHIANTQSDKTETVISNKIDTLLRDINIKSINLLKVDIEGYEYFAFKGAAELLTSAAAPHIIFEFEDWAESRIKDLQPGDAQKLLLEYGYSLFRIEKYKKLKPIGSPITKGSVMILAKKD